MAITQKGEQAKKARVDKAMQSMKPAGKLRRISVEPAENGYTASVDREPDADDMPQGKSKGDAMPMPSYQPPKQHVFSGKNAKQDLLDHISMHLD